MNPDAERFTTLTLDEVAALPAVVDLMTAARALGIGRTTAYGLARNDDFPCPLLRVGGEYRVPTTGLLRALGVDPSIR
ncbi:AlpA family transcriptional regulator [Amycolatopsis sp. WAC 01375]|uniref:helix-turn-helix transcriptional regulator n=1 Tax=Amycolatopsis sp. WAC 01375 TaxID=2203194 RepID=UPI001F3FF1DC|nr:helix-turn-helix domain-containing protein [Amycolatopsis sp. WAC 01375]